MAAQEMIVAALLLMAGLTAPAPAAADSLSIGIDIGPLAPPPVVVLRPHLAVVPGSQVSYAPGAEFNLFAYGGRYWSHHNGAWFSMTIGGGQWSVVATNLVPQPVLAVPVTYYKVPPGQAKKMSGDRGASPRAPAHAKGPKGRK